MTAWAVSLEAGTYHRVATRMLSLELLTGRYYRDALRVCAYHRHSITIETWHEDAFVNCDRTHLADDGAFAADDGGRQVGWHGREPGFCRSAARRR